MTLSLSEAEFSEDSKPWAEAEKSEIDVLLETARNQLVLLQQHKLLPGDLDELRLMFEGRGCSSADCDPVLQGPASRSLRQAAKPEQLRNEESSKRANSESEPEPIRVEPIRVDHEDCIPRWWKHMAEETAKKLEKERSTKGRSAKESQATTRSPTGVSSRALTATSSKHTERAEEAAAQEAASAARAPARPVSNASATPQDVVQMTPRAPAAPAVGAPRSGGPSSRLRWLKNALSPS